jgi:hypothetical protein
VQRVLLVVILAVLVIGFPILISGDTDIPIRDTYIANNGLALSKSEMGNSSASATITITMYTGCSE